MGLSSTANISSTFLNASMAPTFHMAHDAASRPGVSAVGASREAAVNTEGLSQRIEAVEGVLGQARERNNDANMDMSVLNGKSLMGKMIMGAVGFTAAAVIGGPVGAGAGFVMAGIDAARSIKSAMSPSDGPTQFVSYAKGKAGKLTPQEQAENEQLLNGAYTDATGEVSVGGWVQRQPANPIVGSKPFDDHRPNMGKAEIGQLEKAHGAMLNQMEGLRVQGETASKFAFENGISGTMSKGPKPPSGGPGFVSAPSMGMS